MFVASHLKSTIGIGQLVHLGPCQAADSANYPNGMDQSTAETNFLQNVNAAASDIFANMPSVPVGQNQFDAMVSLDFNMGSSNQPQRMASRLRAVIRPSR